MNRANLLAWAQLLRIPNVFTAFADIALGAAVGISSYYQGEQHVTWSLLTGWLLLGLSSGCLYLSGMVWNDIFDREEDALRRPFRPIPSGWVRLRAAVAAGVTLMLLGLAAAMAAGWAVFGEAMAAPAGWATAIAAAVLAYDVLLKPTPLGPLAMGTCRLFNVLLGLSVIPAELLPQEWRWQLAAIVGLYITGVTGFARREESQSRPLQLMAAAGVILLALVAAAVFPAQLPPATGTAWYPYLLVAYGFYVGEPLGGAIRRPTPDNVQAAVRRCILGLVLLDAILATAFVGLWGLLIILLLLPARWLGQWIYST